MVNNTNEQIRIERYGKAKILDSYAFKTDILAVAVRGGTGKDWAAYICVVKGNVHDKEAVYAADNGQKLPYEIAKILFPEVDAEYAWRK